MISEGEGVSAVAQPGVCHIECGRSVRTATSTVIHMTSVRSLYSLSPPFLSTRPFPWAPLPVHDNCQGAQVASECDGDMNSECATAVCCVAQGTNSHRAPPFHSCFTPAGCRVSWLWNAAKHSGRECKNHITKFCVKITPLKVL